MILSKVLALCYNVLLLLNLLGIDLVISQTTCSEACDNKCEKRNGVYCTGSRYNCSGCQNTLFQRSDDQSCTDVTEIYGFTADTMNRILNKCDETAHCMTCDTSASSCSSCFPGYFFNTLTKTCAQSCGDSYYVQNGLTCKLCTDSMNGCNSCVNDHTCTTCSNSLPLVFNATTASITCQQQNALSATNNGFYLRNIAGSQTILESCDAECSSCQDASHHCSACSGAYLASSSTIPFFCVQSCNDGSFYDVISASCVKCSADCLMCDAKNSCILCSNSTYKLQLPNNPRTVCVTTCPSGDYADEVSLSCQPCHQNCATCYGPTQHDCITCNTSLNPPITKLSLSTCGISICGDGIISFETEQCDDGNTLNFDGCSSSCTIEPGWACSPNSLAIDTTVRRSNCKTICGDGLRVDSTHGGQELCDSNGNPGCDPQRCTPLPGYFCHGGSPNSSDTCEYLCSSSCVSCVREYPENNNNGGNADDSALVPYGLCLQCSDGLFAYQGECNSDCPVGFYQFEGVCTENCPHSLLISGQQCVISCDSSNNNTSSGSTILYQMHNRCVSECPLSTYPSSDTSKYQCLDCHFSCSSCNGPHETDCLTCADSFYKQSQTTSLDSSLPQLLCVLSCRDGYKFNSSSKSCEICYLNCESCIPTLWLLNDDCVATCPNGSIANTLSRSCDIFDSPIVSFIFSPPLPITSSSTKIIPINTNLLITAQIQSLYPIISINWHIDNHSPIILNNQPLTKETLMLYKEHLEYSMKIQLRVTVSTSKGTSVSYINLSTYSKPAIVSSLLVNGKQSKSLQGFQDVLTISTQHWPENQLLQYSISAEGTQTNVYFQITEGSSSVDLKINYIFPYLQVSENYEIILNLWNDNLQLTITDSINVSSVAARATTRSAADIFGKVFNLSKLTFDQMDVFIVTMNVKYATQLAANQNYLSAFMNSLEYQQKLGITPSCKYQQICSSSDDAGTCSDSTDYLSCICSNDFTGKFCSFRTEEMAQLDSFAAVLSQSLSTQALTLDQFLSLSLNVTYQTDIGKSLFDMIGKQLPTYLNDLTDTDVQQYFEQFLTLLGQITDESIILLSQGDPRSESYSAVSSQELTFFKGILENLNNLVFRKLTLLDSDNPSESFSYSSSLAVSLASFSTTDFISTQQTLQVATQWASKYDTNSNNDNNTSLLRNRLLVDTNSISLDDSNTNSEFISSYLQDKLVQCEVTVDLNLFLAYEASAERILFDIRRWRFNPVSSITKNLTESYELLQQLETDFIEIHTSISNHTDSAVSKREYHYSQYTGSTIYKLPRVTQNTYSIEEDTNSNDNSSHDMTSASASYNCLWFDYSKQFWDSSTCSVQGITAYHLECACSSINGVVIGVRQFELFTYEESQRIGFLEKLAKNSGLWMSLAIALLFGFCWAGSRDTQKQDGQSIIKKKALRRLIPLLSIIFVRYPMKPLRYRAIQLTISAFQPILIESILFLTADSSLLTANAILLNCFLSLCMTTPVNYLIGTFSIWAQYSHSEQAVLLELRLLRTRLSQPVQVSVQIAQSEEQAEELRKIEIHDTSSQHSGNEQKLNSPSQIPDNSPSRHLSQSLHSFNPGSPTNLVMYPDFQHKRVMLFQGLCIVIILTQASLICCFVGLITSSLAVSYFIITAILGLAMDVVVIDLVFAFIAQYIKWVFKVLKRRGIWFEMPEDLRMKKQEEEEEEENGQGNQEYQQQYQQSYQFGGELDSLREHHHQGEIVSSSYQNSQQDKQEGANATK